MGFCVSSAFAQSTNAELSGRITDPSGLPVPKVKIEAVNVLTNVSTSTETNEAGIYVIPSLQPAIYRILVEKEGFDLIVKPNVELHVQDHGVLNFQLRVGSIATTVTVEGGVPLINTESASVGTVVDRQFAENLPMNGRSFQTLIQLTPGVVVTPSSDLDGGQFSVNGQRAVSNYWMVDGVGANVGISTTTSGIIGNGFGGALSSFSVLGGTNSLVSVDAMQEFRIQTSTYAPEFGRTPGAQISILTRSGTNQFHGTVFDYLRNDILDANDWFADKAGLSKPPERQNDFGGTFSGPISRSRTFFFFSYEGLRLRLPQTSLTNVPDLAARQSALPALQPYLNAYPLPNGADNPATGVAQLNSSYSNPTTLDAYSLRADHKLNNNLTIFGRYNYSPSESAQRGWQGSALSDVQKSRITIHTATVGATWSIVPTISNDLRFNYSRTVASSSLSLDTFGGAAPITSLSLPSPFTTQNSVFAFIIRSIRGTGGLLEVGSVARLLQQQINVVDSLAIQRGSHSLKFGIDLRRLSPQEAVISYAQSDQFSSVSSASTGNLFRSIITSSAPATLLFHNLGVYGQDTWRVIPRLTLTYGLRWDMDFAPSSLNGPDIPAVTGYNLNDLSQLALAPAGTPAFKTTYGNVAPRIGMAYQLRQSQSWQSVVRGGFGVFYDLATPEVGSLLSFATYPFRARKILSGGTFPLSASAAAPPPITAASLASGELTAFNPNLQLPYTLQWNVAIEQALGKQQSVTASYIGSVGRRLIQTADVLSPNPSIGEAYLVTNAGISDYNALQVQFQRRLSRGLQALGSYTWSHSIDTASAGAPDQFSNKLVPGFETANRGPSDFDIRNAFSVGLTYDVPFPKINALGNAVLRGWSTENVIQVRSAGPVDVTDLNFFELNNASADVRPDVVPGQPLYLFGTQYPGGKAFNPAAFQDPPADPSTGNPLRNGNLGRNALRGFALTQWDFAVHRDFPIREQLKLQFRAEMFNVLNHPNFGPPNNGFGAVGFGLSNQMLGQYLSGGTVGSGSFNPQYQIGGPRSIQVALKLQF